MNCFPDFVQLSVYVLLDLTVSVPRLLYRALHCYPFLWGLQLERRGFLGRQAVTLFCLFLLTLH